MYLVGLDLSLNSTGISIYGDGVIKTYTINPSSKLNQDGKLDFIVDELVHFTFPAYSKVVFFIEGYSFTQKSASITILAELAGTLKHLFRENGVSYYIIPPTTLKKYVTGKGNAKKEQMILGVYKAWNKEFATNDEADAFALMQLGIDLCGIEDRLDTPFVIDLRKKLNVVAMGSTGTAPEESGVK